MSEKTIKIAIVVLVAIALIAVGAYFILNKTDNSFTGNYELKSGVYATMENDEDPRFGNIQDKNLKIENAGDGRFIISWVGTTFYGAINNGSITTTGFVEIRGSEYAVQGGGNCKDGILFLYAVCMNSDGKICVCNAVFAKSGSGKSASLQDYVAKGDEYNSSRVIRSVNGEYEVITDTEKLNVKVEKSDNGICILQNTLTISGTTVSYRSLGVVASDHYYYVADTYFKNKWVADLMKVTDDHLTILFNGQLDSERSYAATFTMVKDKPYTPESKFDFLNGLAFSGTARTIDYHKSATNTDTSLTFGTVNGNIVEAVFKIGNYVDSVLVQLTTSKNDGWYFYFNSDISGGDTVTRVIGHISKDLKTINLLTGSFKFYDSCASSVIKLTKSEGSELVGFYYPAATANIIYNYVGDTIDIEKFGNYFTIDNVRGNLFSGTYMDCAINGSLIKIENTTYLMFCLKNASEEYITFLQAIITDDGGVTIMDNGIAIGGSLAGIINFSKEGKTPSFDETNKQIFAVGETFYAFGALERVGDVETAIKDPEMKLECMYSENGLYSFRLTEGTITTMLVGFNSLGSDHVVRLAGFANNTIVSYNVNKHSADLLCFDREYWTSNDKSAVITYRMTPDLSKIPDLPSVPEINKTYECTVNMTFKDTDGNIHYYESKFDLTFTGQNSSLVTMKNDKMSINLHIISGSDNLLYNYFYKFKMNNFSFHDEAYGIFSKDLKTSIVTTMGFGDDGSTIACYIVLKEKA